MPQILIYFSKVAYKPQMTLDGALGRSFANNIKEAIDPDVTISRYNREWRCSQPRMHNGEFFVGKLGFISPATETRTDYDDERKDFIEQSVDFRQGHYVQWVIDLSTQIVAFQTKLRTLDFSLS